MTSNSNLLKLLKADPCAKRPSWFRTNVTSLKSCPIDFGSIWTDFQVRPAGRLDFQTFTFPNVSPFEPFHFGLGDQLADTPYEQPSFSRARGARFRRLWARFWGSLSRPVGQNLKSTTSDKPLRSDQISPCYDEPATWARDAEWCGRPALAFIATAGSGTPSVLGCDDIAISTSPKCSCRDTQAKHPAVALPCRPTQVHDHVGGKRPARGWWGRWWPC